METLLAEELMQAEVMLYEGRHEDARNFLSHLAKDIEDYVDQNFVTSSEVQYFTFSEIFELLSYKKVEDDPRRIEVIEEPFDRVYADLALAYLMGGDIESAQAALKQAVRWNPMECEYRLRLADLYRNNGDLNEYLALTYSCFERASDAAHLVWAYSNFADHFLQTGREMLCASALKTAARLDMPDGRLTAQLEEAAGTAHDPELIDFEEARDLLAAEGLPDGANAEIAICLLMCATDAAKAQDKAQATNLALRARNLVGPAACAALMELIQDADSEASDE